LIRRGGDRESEDINLYQIKNWALGISIGGECFPVF